MAREPRPAPGTYATYKRDVSARLVVRLDNGEEWVAGPEDLKRFHLVVSYEAETAAGRALCLAGLDPDDHHSTLRYAINRAARGDALDPTNDEDAEVLATLRWQGNLFRRGVDPIEWETLPERGTCPTCHAVDPEDRRRTRPTERGDLHDPCPDPWHDPVPVVELGDAERIDCPGQPHPERGE